MNMVLWQNGWRTKVVPVAGAIGMLLISGTWIASRSHAVVPASDIKVMTVPSTKLQLKGVVSRYSADGWPMIDDKVVRLSGVIMIKPVSQDRFARWIASHGGYLECDSNNGGDTFRCLTAQRIDVAQAILLNGAAQAKGDVDPLYRAAEETGKLIHAGP